MKRICKIIGWTLGILATSCWLFLAGFAMMNGDSPLAWAILGLPVILVITFVMVLWSLVLSVIELVIPSFLVKKEPRTNRHTDDN